MKQGFCPALLESRLSAQYINPGDPLWVTLIWQNQGDRPASEDYRFFLDGTFGHQRKLEDKQFDFRVKGTALPSTSRWAPGQIVAVTLKWDVAKEWSGTYELRVGMMDREGVPVSFVGSKDTPVRSQCVGTIDTSWNFGRPWVFEHAHPVEAVYRNPLSVSVEKQEKAVIHLSDGIVVELEDSRPVLCSIGVGELTRRFSCAVPQTVLRERESDGVYREGEEDCVVSWSRVESDSKHAVYHAEASVNGTPAAGFDVVWSVEGREAKVTVCNRLEFDSYELLELRYDTLAELSQGTLLDFWGSGREIPIAESIPAFFEKKYDVRNAAALYDDQAMILVESLHIDSLLTTGILCTGDGQRGFIGGSIVCRVKAAAGIPSIPVKEPPVFTIELPDLAGKKPTWQEAAKLWRRGLQSNPAKELYRNTYFYKQLATWGPLPDEKWKTADLYGTTQNLFRTVTFDQITENAKNFAKLTDGVRQILYVAGWQKGGFDNTYPEPYDAEERCGGLDGLRRCLEEARQYNVVTGLHDNFDDVSTPKVGEFPYTAIDEYGGKWRGWIWPAGMTYIMGLRKYVDSGVAKERIEKMCQLLPLKDTYHLDVLSAEVCRYDFDPEHPASAQDNLQAKLDIIDEFRRYGLDVTSEVLTHPFVGKAGFMLHNRVDPKGEFLPGDRFVPLVQMIYHGTVGYCAPSYSRTELLWGILLGGQTFYEEHITGELCISRYYLQNVPSMMLYGRKMEDFNKNGDCAVAVYEGNSRIETDFAAERYTVVIDGNVVAKDFTTFAPGNHPGVWLGYSMDGGEMRYPAPQELKNAASLTAVTLTVADDGEPVAVRIDGDEIVLQMPAMTPVRVSC